MANEVIQGARLGFGSLNASEIAMAVDRLAQARHDL
jgi:hypothetical protein